jgi:hypothetical protein
MGMTALEYMEKQMRKHELVLEREYTRGAPVEVLQNLSKKISYYEEAADALRTVEGQNEATPDAP